MMRSWRWISSARGITTFVASLRNESCIIVASSLSM
ncbi:MAG: hypothetical protein AW07_02054 [Candidatus Accumulibacter sp. SK-11]|nr:MAG: hypothetical protein AW07_02054 [Candidatus Accumulibacter sp. SK-11]